MKKLTVGQECVFVNRWPRREDTPELCRVVRIGRLYAWISCGDSILETKISLGTFREVCDTNYSGRLYMSMDDYFAEKNHDVAVDTLYKALCCSGRSMISKLKTADIIKIGEMLGVDMTKAKRDAT